MPNLIAISLALVSITSTAALACGPVAPPAAPVAKPAVARPHGPVPQHVFTVLTVPTGIDSTTRTFIVTDTAVTDTYLDWRSVARQGGGAQTARVEELEGNLTFTVIDRDGEHPTSSRRRVVFRSSPTDPAFVAFEVGPEQYQALALTGRRKDRSARWVAMFETLGANGDRILGSLELAGDRFRVARTKAGTLALRPAP